MFPLKDQIDFFLSKTPLEDSQDVSCFQIVFYFLLKFILNGGHLIFD